MFGKRTGHSAVSVDGKLWIFGGSDPTTVPPTFYSDLHIETAPINPVGSPPTPRQYHGAAILKGIMYVVGGEDKNKTALRDFFSLDSAHKWTPLEKAPISTASPSLVATAGHLLLYDGATSGVYSYDTAKKWSTELNKGTATPPKRKHQTAVAFRDGIVIFGGQLDDNTYANDVWYFSTSMYNSSISTYLTSRRHSNME